MVGVDDLDTYAQPNDIGPDDPAPREPQGDPIHSTEQFDIWAFDAEASETVPDVFVVARDPSPLDFRMWVFAGQGSDIHFIMRASHRYGEDDPVPENEDCCEVLMDGQSLRAHHCPTEVEDLVSTITETEVVMPESSGGDSDGPISY